MIAASNQMVMPDTENAQRAWHFRQLRLCLRALARAGAEQRPLFPDDADEADDLAFNFEHWTGVVRGNYEGDLTRPQLDALTAIERQLAVMSRDGAEFDPELWTDAALVTSGQWAVVRRLAEAALDAFGWPAGLAETSDSATNPQTP
jgi:hypothetical protein